MTPDVIVGQGTIGMEIIRQPTAGKKLMQCFAPVGGGVTVCRGIAAYIKALYPEIKVLGVQTVDSGRHAPTLGKGERIELQDAGRPLRWVLVENSSVKKSSG